MEDALADIEDVVEGDVRGSRPPTVARRVQAASAEAERDAARDSGVPGTARVWMKTFGCAHNVSDSEFMAGQLQEQGYSLTEEACAADLWLLNTCTVKNPSQSAMDTVLAAGRAQGKALLVAGCVPQGERDAAALEGLSLLGVTQIDRVCEAVAETLRGNTVCLLQRKALPALDLPKLRRNAHVEILPLSTGCLGSCTYCKTVHARGKLGSYSLEALLSRARAAVADGVAEIWLSSEDTGAYGLDIGTNLSALLAALVEVLPPDRRTMLRLGMTNPPYMLDQLEAVAAALNHPCVYSVIHIPVQSGSNAVLGAMNREYTIQEFRRCVDALLERVPGLNVCTDVICGFPGETDADFQETLELVSHYRFPVVNISQFYPRPGTLAARMPKLPSQTVKARSRALTALHESYAPHEGLVGTTQRAWFTALAADGVQLAGRTKGGVQVLVAPRAGLLGCSATVRVTAAGRWSVSAELVEVLEAHALPALSSAHSADCAAPARSAESTAENSASCCGGEACSSAQTVAPVMKEAVVALRAAPKMRTVLPVGDWAEVALWSGVALGLTGVLAAGLTHLWALRAS